MLASCSFGVAPRRSALWRKIEARVRAGEETARRTLEKRVAQLEAQIRAIESIEVPRVAMPSRAAKIMRETADKHGLTVMDLKSAGRNRRLVTARHEAIFLIIQETTLSTTQVGRLFGGRDHTTIMNAVSAHAVRNGLAPPRGMMLKKVHLKARISQ